MIAKRVTRKNLLLDQAFDMGLLAWPLERLV